MLIAVVSDTHGHEHYTRQAIRMLQAMDVERVIHCGDIGSTCIPPMFAQWPTDFVFGNVDRDETALRAAIKMQPSHRCHGRFGAFQLNDQTIALLHGDDAKRLNQACDDPMNNLVCSGHTHQSEIRRLAPNRVILNPGALFRARPHTFAVVDLKELKPSIISLGEQS